MQKTGKLLVVDDNEEILIAVEMLLKPYFQKIVTAKNPNSVPSILSKELYDIIILDMNFKAGINTGNEGIFWLNQILQVDPEAVVVFITAYGDMELAVKAIREGATDFIPKPWDDEKFITTIQNAYQLRKSKKEITTLKEKQKHLIGDIFKQFPEIIGQSKAMEKVFSTIAKVAKTDANVLITGENGTGKELIAREVHKKSNRADEVFVSVDISALPDSLFESELFGFVKGAFTDAKTDKPGRFEIAEGGTLFLDEIGNLSITAQSKLLTVLQNREINRLGATYKIPIDVRLVCATNKNLDEMVTKGEFREDLLYRINTIQIELPPLRDRKEDIPLLIDFFKRKYEKKYKKEPFQVQDSALKKLHEYHWPGNIRELQHVVEKAVILSDDEYLSASDFGFEKRKDQSISGESLDLNENEKLLIQKAIDKHKGNYSLAAQELGVSRKTLYNKIKKYEIG
jgi:DNA-binding NtrC family response regulator